VLILAAIGFALRFNITRESHQARVERLGMGQDGQISN